MHMQSHGNSAAKASNKSPLGSFFLRTGIYGAFLLATIVGLCGPSYAYDETFHRVYPLTAGGSFVLENVNGSVHVDGWDRDEVEVSAVKTSTNESRDVQQVRIEVDNSKPGQIAVHTL